MATCAFAIAVSLATPTFAQQAADPTAAAATAGAPLPQAATNADSSTPESTSGLSEIVVTAQRRAERLEDVPVSIVAISPEALTKSGITGLQDLGRITPGLQLNFAGAFTQPAIRGVTSLTNGAAAENNIAIYVDGFYVPDSVTINADLVNISDIQVLKGPQGTLYGRNATGGAILINTLAPSETFTGRFEGEYGRFDNKAAKGYLSGPITDNLRYSVAASARRSDGYLRLVDPTTVGKTVGDAAKQKSDSIRVKLEADLGALTATVGLNYGYTSDPRGNIFSTRRAIPRTGALAIPLPPLSARPEKLDEVAFNYPSVVTGKTYEPTLTLALDTGAGTLTSRTSYGWRKFVVGFDFDGSYADLGYSFGRQKSGTFQESVDYAITAIDNVDLVVGGLYYQDHFEPDDPYGTISYGAATATGNALTNPRTGATVEFKTHSYAVYADATIHLSDKLSIAAGGRYSGDKKDVFEFIENIFPNPATQYALPPVSKSAKFHKFTPRASIRYELAPRTNVYASYSVGYRSGSFNPNAVTSAALLLPVNQETLKAYEVGFKTANSIFRAEVAGFIYDFTNYNVTINTVNPLTQSVSTIVGNAPKAKIKGIDAQVTVAPADRTNLTIGAAYVHARFGSFANATGTGFNIATGLNVGSQQQDWTGHQLSRAPNFTANASLDHTFDLFGGALLAATNIAYSDSYVISNPSLFGPLAGPALADKQRFRQKRTTLLNAQITWTDPSDHFNLGVFGKNLTNEHYRASYNGTVLYGDYSVANTPITYGVRAGYKF